MEKLIADAWDRLTARLDEARRAAALWAPVIPAPDWMAPAVALAGLLSLALLSGVAVLSLGTLLAALLIAYLILGNVFGLSVTIG